VPKPNTVPRSTWVAVSYLILAVSYIGMALVLVTSIWAGSLSRLWRDVPSFLPSFRILAMPMVINLALAGVIYKFEHRRFIPRVLGVIVAVGLFVVSSIGAVQLFMLWHRGALPEPFAEAVWTRPIGAAIYGWLAFFVIQLARAANSRWRGP
jgi:hypothetical protein